MQILFIRLIYKIITVNLTILFLWSTNFGFFGQVDFFHMENSFCDINYVYVVQRSNLYFIWYNSCHIGNYIIFLPVQANAYYQMIFDDYSRYLNLIIKRL